VRNPIVAVYVIGVAIGLLATDDRWTTRLLIALCWPLGPLAFVVVATGLLMAAAVLWPLPMLLLATLAGALAITIGRWVW
jgi:hypothetical protein